MHYDQLFLLVSVLLYCALRMMADCAIKGLGAYKHLVTDWKPLSLFVLAYIRKALNLTSSLSFLGLWAWTPPESHYSPALTCRCSWRFCIANCTTVSMESVNTGDRLRWGDKLRRDGDCRSGDNVRRLEDKSCRLKPVASLSEVLVGWSAGKRWMALSVSEITAYRARLDYSQVILRVGLGP